MEEVLTDYHAKYFAHELTKRCSSDSAEKLAGAMAGAQVDLNPHQVDAALFAFNSPLSKGALLADEVGLGKTIEAGLVISQKWAERKRRILAITPSNLRKQWHQELTEKFFLPCAILESKSYNAGIRVGNFRPFEAKDTVVICSYQFARSKAADIHATPWDLVVIDEAHRLRNVYKPANIIANVLKQALAQKSKLLLTLRRFRILSSNSSASSVSSTSTPSATSRAFANNSPTSTRNRYSRRLRSGSSRFVIARYADRSQPMSPSRSVIRSWKSSRRKKAKTGSIASFPNTSSGITCKRFRLANARS